MKRKADVSLKWLYSPDYDRYQEWPGEMSHPEVARDIWQIPVDSWANVWGGLKHPNGTVELGWWPLEHGTDQNEAKRNAPLGLLKHLNKNR